MQFFPIVHLEILLLFDVQFHDHLLLYCCVTVRERGTGEGRKEGNVGETETICYVRNEDEKNETKTEHDTTPITIKRERERERDR